MPHRVLHKYFEVYGQADQITPEAGEKRFLLPWPFLADRVAISERECETFKYAFLTLYTTV